MRLLLVAYPGAGKGTQARMLADRYGVTRLSSGDLLRSEIARGTRIGAVADGYVRRGDLVPDELVFGLLSPRLLEAAATGYVLDGFPRNVDQAEAIHAFAHANGVDLQAVIYLVVGRDELLRRLRVRSKQSGRTDDTESTIANRFDVFEAQTEPLLAYYSESGMLSQVDGDQPADGVFSDITEVLDHLNTSTLENAQAVDGRQGLR